MEPFCVPPGAGGRFAKVLILSCFGCSCPFRPFKSTEIAEAASRKHLNRRSRFTKVLVLSKRIWACNENPRERTLPGREGQKRPKRTKTNRRRLENSLVEKHLNRRGSFRKVTYCRSRFKKVLVSSTRMSAWTENPRTGTLLGGPSGRPQHAVFGVLGFRLGVMIVYRV